VGRYAAGFCQSALHAHAVPTGPGRRLFQKPSPRLRQLDGGEWTALATGFYPNRSGIIANSEYRPDVGWLGPSATEGLEMIRQTDAVTGGKYIRVPTVAEILQAAGHPTLIVGTKPVALLHDRSIRKTSGAGKDSIVLYNGRTMPSALVEQIEKVNDNKKFPTNTVPNTGPR
jgi:hypothetical protein